MRYFTIFLASFVFTIVVGTLSACSVNVETRPSVVEYSKEFRHNLANDLDVVCPEHPTICIAIEDYIILRSKLKR